MSEKPQYEGLVTSIANGKHGKYAVTKVEGCGGSVTFSLDAKTWHEEKEPIIGDMVTLGGLTSRSSGWRASSARFFTPGDQQTASRKEAKMDLRMKVGEVLEKLAEVGLPVKDMLLYGEQVVEKLLVNGYGQRVKDEFNFHNDCIRKLLPILPESLALKVLHRYNFIDQRLSGEYFGATGYKPFEELMFDKEIPGNLKEAADELMRTKGHEYYYFFGDMAWTESESFGYSKKLLASQLRFLLDRGLPFLSTRKDLDYIAFLGEAEFCKLRVDFYRYLLKNRLNDLRALPEHQLEAIAVICLKDGAMSLAKGFANLRNKGTTITISIA